MFKNVFEGIFFSLNQASWKNLPETPSFPGFFMGRVFVYSYPSDTFVKLPVSEIRRLCLFFVFFYSEKLNEKLKGE